MPVTCSTCLSRGRTLVSLDKTNYLSLFGSKKMITKVESVCWECVALFDKLHKFKLQVQQAQKCLKTYKSEVQNLGTLSNLSITKTTIRDICCGISRSSLDCESTVLYTDTIKTDTTDEIQIKLESDFVNELEPDLFDNNDKLSDSTNMTSSFCEISSSNSDCKPTVHIETIKSHVKAKSNFSENEFEPVFENNDEFSNSIELTEIKDENKEINYLLVDKYLPNEERTKTRNRKSNNSKNLALQSTAGPKDYIVIKMTDDEMLRTQEEDRQSDRFKNKCKYRCDLCITGFYHKEKHTRHMEIRHSEKAGDHECHICKVRFTNGIKFRGHIENHYKKYQCRVCQYTSHRVAEMVAHDARSHGLNRFMCKTCLAVFPSPSSLRFHRDTVHSAPVKCEPCDKTFRTKNNLRVHCQVVHCHAPKTQCTVCGARCRQMAVHMLKHKEKPEAAYCAECDRRFSSMSVYKNHLKYAAPHRPPETLKHACSFCDRKFVNSTGLKKHVSGRHTKIRPFQCDRCHKGFAAKCNLRQHILHDHEGVEKAKDKICHICGRGFNTKFMLGNHIRVHTGEKPFRCDACPAAFSQKSSLTTHTRGVHLKIKPRPARHN